MSDNFSLIVTMAGNVQNMKPVQRDRAKRRGFIFPMSFVPLLCTFIGYKRRKSAVII